MSMDGSNLWRYSQGYGYKGPTLAYLTPEQNCRAERIRVARMLWKGQHRCAFLDERRSQFDFTPLRAQGSVLVPYVTFNVLRLISTTLTDLLIGAEPLLRVDDEAAQADLDALASRSNLHRVLYDAICEASWAGETMVEIIGFKGETYVQNVPPGEMFPLGERNPDGQYSQYRRFATAEATINGLKQKLLLETTYSPGLITRELYKLEGTSRGERVTDLGLWPVKRDGDQPLLEKEQTGIKECTIVWMANELDEGEPTSDYDGLLELQDTLNHKMTQIARVLAKHADPKMAVNQFTADAAGSITARHEVFYVRSKDEIPAYVTWDAKLMEALADRDFYLNALCVAAETSPSLLGIKNDATAESARKLRLMATKTLARKDRKGTFVRPFIRRVLDVALGTKRQTVFVSKVTVETRDGLPIDELDQANTISILTGGKQTMSVERGVQLQLPDPAAAAKDIDLIKKEQSEAAALATPSINIGGNTPMDQQNNQPQQVAA
jgi:hypothetical protein